MSHRARVFENHGAIHVVFRPFRLAEAAPKLIEGRRRRKERRPRRLRRQGDLRRKFAEDPIDGVPMFFGVEMTNAVSVADATRSTVTEPFLGLGHLPQRAQPAERGNRKF